MTFKRTKNPNVGKWLLSRYSDGLYYRAKILSINEAEGKCHVRYEDNQTFTTLLKDIQFKPDYGQGASRHVYCRECNSNAAPEPTVSFKDNKIITCDACDWAWHQKCHNPSISDKAKTGSRNWECRDCAYARGQCQDGPPGALPVDTKEGRRMMRMKMKLPYTPSSLTWDAEHKFNTEEYYCYCGGPGEWFMKMLQCNRCSQWYHEACLQCLTQPLLNGDRFYVFVCALCNDSTEYLKRLDMNWTSLLHVVLFNLTVEGKNKWHDFDTVVKWIDEFWDVLQCPSLSNVQTFSRPAHILEVLKSDVRFVNGLQFCRSKKFWSLQERFPCPAPRPFVPPSGPVTDAVVYEVVGAGDLIEEEHFTEAVVAHTTVYQSAPEYKEWRKKVLSNVADEEKIAKRRLLHTENLRERLKPTIKRSDPLEFEAEQCAAQPPVSLCPRTAPKSLEEWISTPGVFTDSSNPFRTEAEQARYKAKDRVKDALLKDWGYRQKWAEEKCKQEKEEVLAAQELMRRCAMEYTRFAEATVSAAARAACAGAVRPAPSHTVTSAEDKENTPPGAQAVTVAEPPAVPAPVPLPAPAPVPTLTEAIAMVRKRKRAELEADDRACDAAGEERRASRRVQRRAQAAELRRCQERTIEDLAKEGVSDECLRNAITEYYAMHRQLIAKEYPFTVYARRSCSAVQTEYLVFWNPELDK